PHLDPWLRPLPDPDRPRLPRRPLLQPLRLSGAGPVHLPPLRPPGHLDHRPLRHRRIRHRLQRPHPEHHLVCPGGRPPGRPRHRPDPGPRPRPRLLARLPPGLPLPVLDARRDGGLHLLRPLPPLGRSKLMLAAIAIPSAHLGHWLWVFYVIPLLIVIAGI